MEKRASSFKAPFNDKRLRQAVAIAIDDEELAQAQVGDEKFWYAEDGSWFKKGNIWYDPDAGKGMYNVHDVARATKLVKESGYNGEKISIIGDKASTYESNAALVLQNQLKAIGLNISIDLFDRATSYELELWGYISSTFRKTLIIVKSPLHRVRGLTAIKSVRH